MVLFVLLLLLQEMGIQQLPIRKGKKIQDFPLEG